MAGETYSQRQIVSLMFPNSRNMAFIRRPSFLTEFHENIRPLMASARAAFGVRVRGPQHGLSRREINDEPEAT